jgi:hypothetical protein
MKQLNPNKHSPEFTVELVNGIPTVISSGERVVKNLMSDRDVIQAKDTPLCCDVSMETYWSM